MLKLMGKKIFYNFRLKLFDYLSYCIKVNNMNPDQIAPWVILLLFLYKTIGQFPVFSMSNICNGQLSVIFWSIVKP